MINLFAELGAEKHFSDMSVLGWVSFITGLIGAICIAVYTYPTMIKTVKTKNTAGVPAVMFTILGLGSLFFLINGVTGIIDNLPAGEAVWAIMLGLTIANFFSFISACITMGLKIHNIIKAKKLHITEAEYCERIAKKDSKKNKKENSKKSK